MLRSCAGMVRDMRGEGLHGAAALTVATHGCWLGVCLVQDAADRCTGFVRSCTREGTGNRSGGGVGEGLRGADNREVHSEVQRAHQRLCYLPAHQP